MRILRPVAAAVAFSFVALTSCNDAGPSRVAGLNSIAIAPATLGTDHVVISEFRFRGPNGGNDEFVELYNPTASAVDISGWRLRGSNSAGTTSIRATVGAGVILPSGGFYLFTNAAASGYSGTVPGNVTYGTGITDDGGVAISLPDGVTNVDQAGLSTGSAFKEGTPLASLTTNVNRGYTRLNSAAGCPSQDTGNNSVDFVLLAPSDPRNAASPVCNDNVSSLSGAGAANPVTVGVEGTSVLTVTVVPATDPASTGIAVFADLSVIGGSNNQPFLDDGQGADATAGDNVFTFAAVVVTNTTLGLKTLPVSITDAQSRTASAAIQLTVTATPGTVVTVTVTAPSSSMFVGSAMQLTAEARDFFGTVVPTTFTWSGPDVSASGELIPTTPGLKTITATAPNGVSGSAGVTAQALPDVHIVEIHYDNDGTDTGEAVEIDAAAGTNLAGWSLVLYNGNGGVTYGTPIALGGTIANLCNGRGVLSFPAPGLQNGAPDGIALVAPAGVVEFLSYEGVMVATNGPAAGMTSVDIGRDEDGDETPGLSLQKDALGWYGPNPASFGACNAALPPFVSIGGNSTIPVGFERQLFATLNDGRGGTTSSTFTFESQSATATVDADGVMHAVSAGPAIIKATAATGATGTRTFTMYGALPGSALYANHVEFGVPTDADASDEVVITRAEFTSSFSRARGIPNWVSFNLESSHYGTLDRCDCFTFDPLVAAQGIPGYTTADYSGAGTAAGYGIDRGHLARSFDRTSGELDNARTFYFSNIIPQASDNNQGPWANMENAMGDLARFSNKELFVIAGASGSKGTVKNEGRITIPSHTWKVVVVLPKDQGLVNIDSRDDFEVFAVIMPNDPGIRTNPNNPDDWKNFLTTVDAVEALSGYDLLSLLPDQIEIAVESNTQPPAALLNGPWSALRNEAVPMSAAGSSDPDNDALTYSWNFGDGATGSGLNVSHAYASAGSFTVTLTVTDVSGLTATATSTATITHPAQAAQDVITLVQSLPFNAGNSNALTTKLDAAIGQLNAGNSGAAANQLNAFLNQVDAFVKTGKLSAAQANALRAAVNRILATL